MKLVSANIQNFNPDLTPAQVKRAAKIIADLEPWVFVGQEIHPPDADAEIVKRVLGPRYDTHFENTPLVHFYDSRKVTVHSAYRQQFDYPRRLNWTPRPRQVTAVSYKINNRPALPPVCIIDGHFPAGGYNAANPGTPDAKNRRKQWDIEAKGTKDLMETLLSNEITCILAADLNHPKPPEMVEGIRWIADHGPDHIGVVAARRGVGVRVLESKVVKIPGDHDALYVDLALRNKS